MGQPNLLPPPPEHGLPAEVVPLEHHAQPTLPLRGLPPSTADEQHSAAIEGHSSHLRPHTHPPSPSPPPPPSPSPPEDTREGHTSHGGHHDHHEHPRTHASIHTASTGRSTSSTL
uniref:Uncharacterized protein n=1 Tax=Haptolina brevifila TaxID=156173 RepID=A0A7S2I148_9EUKA|mmetsp:Transcript_59950/g.119033  ORF Transcript_59950/g.119033 Transcript_59950/m.119033 type:complete len:115 (+) Transcript_59950:3-347(+)